MPVVKLASPSVVPEGSGKRFEINGHVIAVFQAGGVFYAIDDTCSHAEASLSEGEFDPDELCIECPLHGSRFDLRSGAPRSLPAFEPVSVYRVWADGDELFLEYSA